MTIDAAPAASGHGLAAVEVEAAVGVLDPEPAVEGGHRASASAGPVMSGGSGQVPPGSWAPGTSATRSRVGSIHTAEVI